MNKTKLFYWSTTILIFLMEGVMPALTSQTEMAKEGIRHLGYPEYFGNALVVFKVVGTLLLIVPQVPMRLKDLAYGGFLFDFLFAAISLIAVDGLNAMAALPIVFMGILAVSYSSYHQLQATRKEG